MCQFVIMFLATGTLNSIVGYREASHEHAHSYAINSLDSSTLGLPARCALSESERNYKNCSTSSQQAFCHSRIKT